MNIQPGTNIVATYTPISSGSLQFSGGATSHSAPYLSLSPGIPIAGGAYTIEGYFQLPNFSAQYGIVGGNADYSLSLFVSNNNSFISDSYGGRGQRTYTVITMLPNTWYYFALTRNSSLQETMFVGTASTGIAYRASVAAGGTGSSGGVQTNSLNYYTSSNPTNDIGTYYGQAWPGLLSNLKVTVGSNTVDPTQTSITLTNNNLSSGTNTKYLMGYTTTTSDLSLTQTVTNHGVTKSANQPFTTSVGTPLKITSIYTAPPQGGSYMLSLNGSNYLTLTNSSFSFGTGDFTVEGWYYATSSIISGCYWGGTGGNYNTFSQSIQGGTGDVSLNSNIIITYSISPANTWHHYAVVRSSGTVTLYIDGVVSSSVNNANSQASITESAIWLGYLGVSGYNWVGNIRDFRITNKAVYTGAFTAPARGTVTTTQSAGTNISAITSGQCLCLISLVTSSIVDSTGLTTITNNGTVTTLSGT